jgi:phage-related tail fiber protein
MIDICKRILGDENRGATHFVSSIDLGAKLYYKETVNEKEKSSKVSANAGLEAGSLVGADAGISRIKQAIRKAVRNDMIALIHHEVEMNDVKTAVLPEREMVIGCKVSPVWLLVTDRSWRQAMKAACAQYVKEHTTEYSHPTVASGENW